MFDPLEASASLFSPQKYFCKYVICIFVMFVESKIIVTSKKLIVPHTFDEDE